MNYQAILHIPMSEYAFALSENALVFRVRCAKDDIKECVENAGRLFLSSDEKGDGRRLV